MFVRFWETETECSEVCPGRSGNKLRLWRSVEDLQVDSVSENVVEIW